LQIADVRHVSVAGWRGAHWRYIPLSGFAPARILATVILGASDPRQLEIAICSLRHPVAGAWVLTRTTSGDWVLTAMRWPSRPGRVAHAVPFAPDMPTGSLRLSACPPTIQRDFEALVGPPR
jgi:hypothetical protein